MAFILNKSEHTVGDHRCCECWRGYPVKCLCGGFIHAQFVKEEWDNNLILTYGCDVCGDKFKFRIPRMKPKFQKRRRFNKS